MAQGTRRRLFAAGAGLLICTGLAGCMNDDKKSVLPVARTPGLTPSSTNSSLPAATGRTPSTPASNTGLPTTGGIPQSSGFPTSTRTPSTQSSWSPAGQPNPNNTGMIQAPVVPGDRGPGAPLPTTTTVPSVLPPQSGFSTPDWQPQSSAVGQPVSARGAMPNVAEPPVPELIDPMPPRAPEASTGNASASIPSPPTPAVGPLSPADHPPHK